MSKISPETCTHEEACGTFSVSLNVVAIELLMNDVDVQMKFLNRKQQKCYKGRLLRLLIDCFRLYLILYV